MIDLKSVEPKQSKGWARNQYVRDVEGFTSFEHAADYWVQQIFETFRTPDGDPTFALGRVFRTLTPSEVPDGLLPLAGDNHNDWLALIAAAGSEAAWNDRRQSSDRRLSPLDLEVSGVPKISAGVLNTFLSMTRCKTRPSPVRTLSISMAFTRLLALVHRSFLARPTCCSCLLNSRFCRTQHAISSRSHHSSRQRWRRGMRQFFLID